MPSPAWVRGTGMRIENGSTPGMPRRVLARGAAALLWIAIGCLAWESARAAPPPPPPAPAGEEGFLDETRARVRSRDLDGARALAAGRVNAARARGDRAALAFWLRTHGQLYAGFERPEAEAILNEALAVCEAIHDTANWLPALRWQAVTVGNLGRTADARRLALRLLAMGRARGDRAAQGQALNMLAYRAFQVANYARARAQYDSAVVCLLAVGDSVTLGTSLTGLGRVFTERAQYDSARITFEKVIALGEATGNRFHQGHGWNNLGVLEARYGDPSLAAGFYQRAYEIQRNDGNVAASLTPLVNTGISLMRAGRFDGADSVLQQAIVEASDTRLPSSIAFARNARGVLLFERGRSHESAASFRAALATQGDVYPHIRSESRRGLARALARSDSAEAALEIIDSDLGRRKASLPTLYGCLLLETRGEILWDLDRVSEAARAFEAADRAAFMIQASDRRFAALSWQASCEARLGDYAAAERTLEEAGRIWEFLRTFPQDPEWRAIRGASATRLSGTLAEVALNGPSGGTGAGRRAQAFDRLQKFKSRALHERLFGPFVERELPPVRRYSIASRVAAAARAALSPSHPAPTVASLQERTLRDDELLLDAFVGLDSSYLFAVTKSECRVVRLPGAGPLGEKIRLYRDLCAAWPAENRREIVAEAGRACAALLLTGIEDLTVASRRIWIAPDGPLHALPWSALRVSAGDGSYEWLGAGREIVRVPSSTVLAWFRSNDEASRRSKLQETGPDRRSIAVLAGLRQAGGRKLTGVEREVRYLRSHFGGVTVRAERERESLDLDELSNFEVLHVAAHITVDDQRPWSSGILLSSEEDPTRVRYVRASELSQRSDERRLAVLSGCESAGGRVLSGEGVQGLATALLGSGTRAVVATLWPVEDRATATLAQALYRRLGRGMPVAEALRGAQEELASRPQTADPFYWAGFVIIGDGVVVVPLRPRSPAQPWLVALGAGLLLFGAYAFRRYSRQV